MHKEALHKAYVMNKLINERIKHGLHNKLKKSCLQMMRLFTTLKEGINM